MSLNQILIQQTNNSRMLNHTFPLLFYYNLNLKLNAHRTTLYILYFNEETEATMFFQCLWQTNNTLLP